MMLSLKKKAYEEKKKMFLFVSLSLTHTFSPSLPLSLFCYQKKKREREKQKLSSPLETNQLDFFSHFFFSFFTIYNQIKKESRLFLPKRISAFDTVHYNLFFFCFEEFNSM